MEKIKINYCGFIYQMVPDTCFLKTYLLYNYHDMALHITSPAQFNTKRTFTKYSSRITKWK